MKLALLPAQMVTSVGCAEIAGGAVGVIVNDKILVCVTAPAVPVTVML